MTPSVVSGEIDRISGSGNGMLRTDDGEYNLGPIDKSVVGSTAVAVPMNGTWAVCLTPSTSLETYLSRFCSTAGIDEANVLPHLPGMADQQVNSVDDLLSDQSVEFAVGDTIEVEITVGNPDRSYVISEDWPVIEVVNTYLPSGEETTVEIVEVAPLLLKARISPDILKRVPEPGTELDVVVQKKLNSTGYGMTDDVPVILPQCKAAEGDKLRVGVESVEQNGIIATVDALPMENRPDPGDVLYINTDFLAGDSTQIRTLDGIPLKISRPARPMTGPVPILISGGKRNVRLGQIDFASYDDAPELGTELTVTIESKKGSTAYSSYNNVPIILPRCPASEGDRVRVAASEYLETGVKATTAALPAETRPDTGDTLRMEVSLPANNSKTLKIHDGIPIKITQAALSLEGVLPVEIVDIQVNSVTGRVDLAAHGGVSEGAQLSVNGITHRDDQLICRKNGTPIVIPISEPIPSAPDSLPVTVTDIRADAAYANVHHQPEIRTLEPGDTITVTTAEHTNGYLIAEYEGYPVWVSWPFDETECPPRLTVEISEITEVGLFASPPVLLDTDTPQDEDIIPATIETVHSDHIRGSIVEPVKNEPYVLPITIPVSFDAAGEIGIRIVDQKQSHLIGVVRTLDTGENVTQVPVYLQKIQETILAVREQQFKHAATSAKAAADATETGLRRAEALRFQIFASGETILSAEGSEEQVFDEIADPYDRVSSIHLRDDYQNLIDTEFDIYEELISISADQVPDSVHGLQQIAYNIDTRGRLDRTVRRIREELLDQTADTETSGWAPEFPHPLLVFRIAQLCTQFDSPPKTALKLVNQCSKIDRLRWQIPPRLSPEPSPDETVSVVPKSTGRSSDTGKLGETDTYRPLNDGETGSDSKIDSTTNDQSHSDQPSNTTTEDVCIPDKPTEDQLATSSELDASDPAETAGDIQQPAEDSDDNPSSAATTDIADDDEPVHDLPDFETEYISSTQEPATANQLKSLRAEAEAAASDDPVRDTSSAGSGSRYQRASAIKKYVQARANGHCEACGESAPFKTPDGRPYLETHHIEELGQGGEDHPDKVAAVCPTCHKRIHYGADGDALNEALTKKLEDELSSVGVD